MYIKRLDILTNKSLWIKWNQLEKKKNNKMKISAECHCLKFFILVLLKKTKSIGQCTSRNFALLINFVHVYDDFAIINLVKDRSIKIQSHEYTCTIQSIIQSGWFHFVQTFGYLHNYVALRKSSIYLNKIHKNIPAYIVHM